MLLTSITIPASVASIKDASFANCSNLTSVICLIKTPLEIYSNVFNNVNIAECNLEVPLSSEAAYKNADVWKDFKTVKGTLSTDTFTTQKETVLYPNPFSDELFVELNSTDAAQAEIIDLNGKKLFEKSLNKDNNKIDTCNLLSGMYFVKISEGNDTTIKKVIKR